MKVIIAGSRKGFTYEDVKYAVEKAFSNLGISRITEVVSGCAYGVDRMGEQFAAQYGIPVRKFPADWDTHGKKAGYLRNIQMAEYGDVLVALSYNNSRGTKMMIELARKYGLQSFVLRRGDAENV